jgi:hypothetical protein
VFLHRLGEIRDRTYENQQHRASGLNLVVTAIILWNTRYLDRTVNVQALPAAGLFHSDRRVYLAMRCIRRMRYGLWGAGRRKQDRLKAWITVTLPRTTREVGAWIETECVTYDSRSGLIALLHRLGMEHRKPKAVSSKLDPDKQAAYQSV